MTFLQMQKEQLLEIISSLFYLKLKQTLLRKNISSFYPVTPWQRLKLLLVMDEQRHIGCPGT